jgi:hypothetical protein
MKASVLLNILRMSSSINLDQGCILNSTWAKWLISLRRKNHHEPIKFPWKGYSNNEMEIKSNTIFIIFKKKLPQLSWQRTVTSHIPALNSTLKYTKLITTLASRNNQPSIRLVTLSELQKTEDNVKSFFTSATQLKMLRGKVNQGPTKYLASFRKEHKILGIGRPFNENIMRKTNFQTGHGCYNNLYTMCKSIPLTVAKVKLSIRN